MKVIVDTSVWSLALRRRAPSHQADEAIDAVDELQRLIRQGRVALLGPVRQELLSGIRDADTFARLRDHLRPFEDERLGPVDFERAAEHFNTCRTAGVQGSNTDFLLSAVSERLAFPILTTDADFTRYARHLPVRLHAIARGV